MIHQAMVHCLKKAKAEPKDLTLLEILISYDIDGRVYVMNRKVFIYFLILLIC
jgi:hypothetical protein